MYWCECADSKRGVHPMTTLLTSGGRSHDKKKKIPFNAIIQLCGKYINVSLTQIAHIFQVTSAWAWFTGRCVLMRSDKLLYSSDVLITFYIYSLYFPCYGPGVFFSFVCFWLLVFKRLEVVSPSPHLNFTGPHKQVHIHFLSVYVCL